MMRALVVLVCSLMAVIAVGLVINQDAQAAPVAQDQDLFIPLVEGAAANDALRVSPQPDNDRAASATIPLSGGEVVATSANGTRFTLTIPPGALLQTTTITLTPVVEIAGLPAVELVGAVEIQPLNLLLFQAASLQIEPAQALPVAEEYPFAYYSGGQDFHPYPILPYSEALIFPIGRFEGGYGIAREGPQAVVARGDALAFTPADPEAQLRSRIAALIRAERERMLLGEEPDPELWPKVRELLLEFYEQVIKPMLQRSMEDCDFAQANMGKALGWLRSVQLLFGDNTGPGADPVFAAAADEILNALISSIENCYRKAAAPCLDWDDPEQVGDVLRYYRSLLLLGAEGNVTAPEELPECTFVNVTLQGGAFHYEFERDAESGWDQSVHFQFVDDTVSGVGFYYPFIPKGSPIAGPSAIISVTALIDDLWQPVPLTQRFFCRDQKAERLQELVITFAEVEGEPTLPPQLYADNIGCWRWSGTVQHDTDYDNLGPSVPEYYMHTSGEVTLERDTTQPYFAYDMQGELTVNALDYRLIAPGVVDYDHSLRHVDHEGATTCIQTLTAHITNPETYVNSTFPAITLPNAGFGLPREVDASLGAELAVDLPYTTQGFTCPGEGQSLDHITLPLAGELSADGRHITLDETGDTGEQTGTFHRAINLTALRE